MENGGAVMGTGSHNPTDYNGFKMMLGRNPVFGAQIHESGRMARGKLVVEEKMSAARTIDIQEEYVHRLRRDWDGGDRKPNVVWDNGNGSAGGGVGGFGGGVPG